MPRVTACASAGKPPRAREIDAGRLAARAMGGGMERDMPRVAVCAFTIRPSRVRSLGVGRLAARIKGAHSETDRPGVAACVFTTEADATTIDACRLPARVMGGRGRRGVAGITACAIIAMRGGAPWVGAAVIRGHRLRVGRDPGPAQVDWGSNAARGGADATAGPPCRRAARPSYPGAGTCGTRRGVMPCPRPPARPCPHPAARSVPGDAERCRMWTGEGARRPGVPVNRARHRMRAG